VNATTTPPDLLTAKQPVVIELAKELRISRWHVYGLIRPSDYRDAIPADLFDTRSDLADRVAKYAGCSVKNLRDFYAAQKDVA